MFRSKHLMRAAAVAALAAIAAPALAEPVTIQLNDANQLYTVPAGQSLFIRTVTWLPEADATHEMLSMNASGFGSAIQLFKPASGLTWSKAPGKGVFLAASGAMPPARLLSLKNARVDWRDMIIDGDLIANDDAEAWSGIDIDAPDVDGGAFEALTVTLKDASPTYTVPVGKRFVTRNLFVHLDTGASARKLDLVYADGQRRSLDLTTSLSHDFGVYEPEPQTDRIVRFIVDSEAAGVAAFSIDDGSGGDLVDVSISGFLVDASSAPAEAAGPILTRYDAPTLPGPDGLDYRIDRCANWNTDCDQTAAQKFCRTKGHADAASFEMAWDYGLEAPTITIASRQVCASAHCDGFAHIVCADAE